MRRAMLAPRLWTGGPASRRRGALTPARPRWSRESRGDGAGGVRTPRRRRHAGPPPARAGRLPHADQRRAPDRARAGLVALDVASVDRDRAGGTRPGGPVRGSRPLSHRGMVHNDLPGPARVRGARSRRGARRDEGAAAADAGSRAQLRPAAVPRQRAIARAPRRSASAGPDLQLPGPVRPGRGGIVAVSVRAASRPARGTAPGAAAPRHRGDDARSRWPARGAFYLQPTRCTSGRRSSASRTASSTRSASSSRHCNTATSPRSHPSDFPLARVDEPGLGVWRERIPIQGRLSAVPDAAAVPLGARAGGRRSASRNGDSRSAGPSTCAAARCVGAAHRATRDAADGVHDGGVGGTLQVVLGAGPAMARGGPSRSARRGAGGADSGDRRAGAGARVRSAHRRRCSALHLVRLGEDRYDLLWTTHHLYIDGWSWPVVFEESAAIYGALRSGSAPSLPEPCPYGRYIRWLSQRRRRLRSILEGRARRIHESTPLDLGAARRRRARPGDGGPRALPGRAARAAGVAGPLERHVTLSSVMQAAWALLLSHYSGLSDVVFGAAFSGRPPELPGIDELVGPCVNNVPVAPASRIRSRSPPSRRAPAQTARAEPAPIRAAGADPGLGRGAAEPASVRQPHRLPELHRRRGACGSAASAHRLLVGPDATNYPITLVVVPGPSLRFKLLWPE